MTTSPTSGVAIQRYEIGYPFDEWVQRSSTPSVIPDASGSWVRYADHVTALAAGQATAAQAVVQDDLITIRRPTTRAEMLWLLKLAHLVISDVDKTLEETFAPAQPAAQQPHRSGCTAGTDEECVQRGCGTNCPAVSPRQGVAYAALPDEREMLKHALWLASSLNVHRYMMSCAEGRWSGAEKATCHDELCCLYVAVFRGVEVDQVRVDFEADWMAVHDATQELTDHMDVAIGFPLKGVPDYEALAPKFFAYFHRLATHALRASHGQAPAGAGEAAEHYRNAIARARLLDSDLSNLTERGAKAWAGVDAQGLRDGGASPSANAGEPSAHIKEPYTLAEIKAKIASNDYSAEMLLQHAMLLLDSAQEDAARYRYLRDGDWREHEKLESVIRLQLNALWDETIDAARKQGEKQ